MVDRTRYVINENDAKEARDEMQHRIIDQGREYKRFKILRSECPYNEFENRVEWLAWSYGYDGLFPEDLPSDSLEDEYDEDGSRKIMDADDR